MKQLVANMFETMYNADGVGLAAPQVGLSIRLVVIDGDVMGDDFPECKGFKRALINPEFLERSEEEIAMEEGCLSLPGIHEKVSRSKTVRVRYWDGIGRSTRKWWKVSPPVLCSMSASI